jgi:predicted acylesterase/phospholipase RssA
MKTIVPLSLISLLFSTTTATEGICRALALSGGGNKGAYEAGVISGLVNSLPPDQVTWDVVSGVSAGALNAAGMAIFKKGDEVNMSHFLLDLWGNITTENIWTEWPEGLIHGLFNESGIFNDTPLFNLLTNIINKSDGIQRSFIVSADDTRTGEYHTFDESTPREELPTAVISSASIPAVFPDRNYKGYILMDGGTVWNTNLVSAVQKCMDMGFEKS